MSICDSKIQEDWTKDDLIAKIKAAEKKYYDESPCLHCGPGNGCDDCRGCEDSKRNYELEKAVKILKDEYERQFGEKYKPEWEKKFEEKQIKLKAIDEYYRQLENCTIEEFIEKNIKRWGADEFYNILENCCDQRIKDAIFNCVKESVFKQVKPISFDTIKDLAKGLNGNERHDEMWIGDDPQIAYDICERKGWIVAYPCSDDLLELEGAYSEEFGAYDGCIIKFVKEGDFYNIVDDCYDDDDTYKKAKENMFVNTKHDLVSLYDISIEAIWEPVGSEYTWKILVNGTPCEYFDIMEDGKKWARGAVIDMNKFLLK